MATRVSYPGFPAPRKPAFHEQPRTPRTLPGDDRFTTPEPVAKPRVKTLAEEEAELLAPSGPAFYSSKDHPYSKWETIVLPSDWTELRDHARDHQMEAIGDAVDRTQEPNFYPFTFESTLNTTYQKERTAKLLAVLADLNPGWSPEDLWGGYLYGRNDRLRAQHPVTDYNFIELLVTSSDGRTE